MSPVLGADEFAAYFTLTVDDVGFRRAGGAKGQITLLRFIVDGEQIDVVVDEKLVVGIDVVVEIYGKDNDLRHLFLQGNERGQLFKAWSAP